MGLFLTLVHRVPQNVVPMDGALGPWGSVTDEWNVTYRGTFNVSANFLGYSTLNLTLLDKDGEVGDGRRGCGGVWCCVGWLGMMVR